MEKSEKLVAGLGGLVEGEQSSHQRAAQLTAGLGVEDQPYRGGSVELTNDLVATQFDMTGRVRQQQPAAAPTASNRGCLHENAVAPNRSAVSLLHLAEQPPAEVVGALSQLVLRGRVSPSRFGRHSDVWIAHTGAVMPAEGGVIGRDFRKSDEGKFARHLG